LALSHDLANRLHFWGLHESVRDCLSAFDVLVLPSRQEGMGLAILEAMAAGLPVIGTSVGGIPEAIVHGRTGFVISAGDYESLARHLRQLMQDEQERITLGTRGKERAFNMFNRPAQLEKVARMYAIRSD